MSDWRSRLRPLRLTSPSGIEFTPGWKSDKQTVDLDVGQYSFPGVQGTKTQPMAAEGYTYPLTLFFEGPDNDKESKRFLETIARELAQGPWNVEHPVDGHLRLQPIGQVERPLDPTTSGNLTVVSSSWIVPLEEIGPLGAPAAAAEVTGAVEALTEAVSLCLSQVAQDTASQTAAIESGVKAMVAKVKKTIAQTNARLIAIQGQINDTITKAKINVEALAGEISSLLSSPGLSAGSVFSRVAVITQLGQKFLDDLPSDDEIDATTRNSAVVVETFATSALAAAAAEVVSEAPETRAQALAILAQFNALDAAIIVALDDVAGRSSGNLEDQYFASRVTTQALADLRARVARYLHSIIGDLKIEQRFTLDRPRAPIMIAIEKYKATPESADTWYRFFCRTNNLHGRELLWRPAGWEYVIYA